MDDSRGVALSTGDPRNLAAFEAALRALNTYNGDPVVLIDAALAADPSFVMGHVLRAHVHLTLWERSVVAEIETSLAALRELDSVINDRERQHVRALDKWAAGDWDAMRGHMDRLVAEYPRDLLALQAGHIADFFHGDRDNLRGRVLRALPAWSRGDTGYAFVLGMLAFGHEECGSYALAEETGRHALALEPDDCWAHHAVAHVMEMQGRQAEGIAFMEARRDHWAQEGNAFAFHNWWHTALYHLDQDRVDRAFDIYDKGVRPEPSEFQLTMLDAVALLWRMHLRGIDVGGRWDELAAAYKGAGEDGFYAFNDMHAMMAYAATGRMERAASLLAAIEASAGEGGTNAMMSRAAGLSVVRAVEAFGRERYAEAADLLMPVRYRANVFGGSHAQRDIIHRTLIEAALRAGDRTLATALVNERLGLKPHCPFNLQLRERAAAA